MDKNQTIDTGTPVESPLPGPWAWCALLLTGVAISGLFPWLMVSWAAWRRGRKRVCLAALGVNIAIFLVLSWLVGNVRLPWWWLNPGAVGVTLIWSAAAWVFQGKIVGAAAPRFTGEAMRSSGTALLTGAFIGACAAIVISIPEAFEGRLEMQAGADVLNRDPVLWDLFSSVPAGVAAGLIPGFWWAGEREKFSTSHVISFVTAFILTFILFAVLNHLSLFVLFDGVAPDELVADLAAWAVAPRWAGGFRGFWLKAEHYNFIALLVVPLLFGAPARVRDFGKRALLIPLAWMCAFLLPASHVWWTDIQHHIIHEMSSPDDEARASAHERAEILLRQYPNHLRWPAIAEAAARYSYAMGDHETSGALYREIVSRHGESNQWRREVERARGALYAPGYDEPSFSKLPVPVVDYEEYLTHNWMALLCVVRYWEGAEFSESDIKIRLKDLSKSDDNIQLTPINGLAELDDRAAGLGFEMVVMEADLSRAKALLAAGIPVLHPVYNTLRVIYGHDERRSALMAFSFDQLSRGLRKKARKEAREILEIEDEGRGESRKRLARIAHEAHAEDAYEFWQGPVGAMGPLMAVVHPTEKRDAIADVLDAPMEALKKESDGLLAGLIALSFLNNADPVQAVEWAKRGAAKTENPTPLYAAHLARVLWDSREKGARARIPLRDAFPDLKQIFDFFDHPDNKAFFTRARERFEADLDAGALPWRVSRFYTSLLDPYDATEFDRLVDAVRGRLSFDPAHADDWRALAEAHEFAGDIPAMVEALEGWTSADPLAYKAKLRLAFGHVLLGNHAAAKATLDAINPDKIRFDADHPFCLGAVAESEGDVDAALRHYEKAVEMRRYKSIYFVKYGNLLMREGSVTEARKALEWAGKIDPKTSDL